MEGGIWPTQKFWCGAPYGLLQVGFIIHNKDKVSTELYRS